MDPVCFATGGTLDAAAEQIVAAVLANDPERVNALLEADAGLVRRGVQDERLFQAGIFHWLYVGDTYLHLAAAGYRVEIVKAFLKRGADPNACGNRRRATPLHYAADGFINGPAWNPDTQTETIAALLGSGARIDAQDANGAAALHRAVRTRSAAAAEYLLQSGANPTLPNKAGSTPFHLAVQSTGRGGSGDPLAREEQRKIIECFVRRGVSADLRDGRGATVLQRASRSWVRQLLPGRDTPG